MTPWVVFYVIGAFITFVVAVGVFAYEDNRWLMSDWMIYPIFALFAAAAWPVVWIVWIPHRIGSGWGR